jgi:hypothetical protein
MVIRMDTQDGQRSAAELAAQVINGAAREQDVRLMALMVLGRDQLRRISGHLVAWWLMAHGWSLREHQTYTNGHFVELVPEEHSRNVALVPILIDGNGSVIHTTLIHDAARTAADVMERHPDDVLAEWMSLVLDIESDVRSEQDRANALEIAMQ